MLCETGAGQGGAWNRDGVIVYADFKPPNTGLYRVLQTGGLSTLITKAEAGAHRMPVFLPDGRRFLYVAIGGKENGIYLASLDSKESRRLVLDESKPAYFEGHLLFVREQTLMAQPVDPHDFAAKGDLFPVAEQVSHGANPGDFFYSISTQGMLIYQPGAGGGGTQHFWFDRSGKEMDAVGGVVQSRDFALSLDAKRMVVERETGSNRDLWITDLEHGNTESRFTFEPGLNSFPVWSPDRAKVVYGSNRGNGAVMNLYQRASNGTGQDELLFESKENKFPWDWSRDGKFLIYSSRNASTQEDLFALPLTGEKRPIPLVATKFRETQGQLSPDGRWLAYTSDESGRYQVYVQPFAPGWAKPVTGKWQVSLTSGGTQAHWRRDGKELFYMAPDRKLRAVEIRATAQSFDHGAPQALFESRSEVSGTDLLHYGYQPSADGKKFLISAAPGAAAEPPPLTVVVNWLAGVKK